MVVVLRVADAARGHGLGGTGKDRLATFSVWDPEALACVADGNADGRAGEWVARGEPREFGIDAHGHGSPLHVLVAGMRMALDDEAVGRGPLVPLARGYSDLLGEDPRLLPTIEEVYEDGALEPVGQIGCRLVQ